MDKEMENMGKLRIFYEASFLWIASGKPDYKLYFVIVNSKQEPDRFNTFN
jgi:hypothetical protein